MQFILGCFILTKIRELITEVIEILDELFKLFLLCVRSMNEFEVLLLDVIETTSHSFPLDSHLSEHFLHLALVSITKFLPNFKNGGLEITVNIGDSSLLGCDSLSGRLRSLNLCLFLLCFTTFSTFFLSLLALFFFFGSDTDSFSLCSLILIKFRINLLLNAIFLCSFSFNDSLDNFLDFFRHFSLRIGSIKFVQDASFDFAITKLGEPVLQRSCTLIKRHPSVN